MDKTSYLRFNSWFAFRELISEGPDIWYHFYTFPNVLAIHFTLFADRREADAYSKQITTYCGRFMLSEWTTILIE